MSAPGERPATEPAALTIAITGASGHVGRTLVGRLRGSPHRLVALVRGPMQLAGAECVAAELAAPAAQAALRDADVIVHLAGALRPAHGDFEAANLATSRAVADAARHGRARRIVFVSFPGAGASRRNAYLRTKGVAERVLQAAGKEVVVFRTTTIVGPPGNPGPAVAALLARANRRVNALGTGTQRTRPVLVDDVVTAIVAACTTGRAGVYELAGPDEMTLDDLIRVVNRDPDVSIAHLPGWAARIAGPVALRLPRAMVDILTGDATADPARAVAEFGLRLTPVAEAWRP